MANYRMQQTVESLVDHVYEAMLDRAEWPRFLARLTDALDGMLPMLFMHDAHGAGSVMICSGYDEKAVRDFHNYYQARNVWLQGAMQKRLLTAGRVRTSHMTCSRREFLRSEYYDGWCRPQGISQAIGSTILKDRSWMFNLTVMRDAGEEFGRKEIALFETLMPHLQRALKVHVQLADGDARRSALADALDGLSVAVLVVEANGRVLHMNREAELLAKSADGFSIDASGPKAARPQETAKLQSLIGAAAATSARRGLHGGGVVTLTRPSGRKPLEVLVSPLRAEKALSAFHAPAALVYITDPERLPEPPEAWWQEAYGLTRAEARVAVRSAQGLTIDEIASVLGVSPNTVKTQLKSVFAKTNSKRQRDLVRLVLGGIAKAARAQE